MTYHPVYPPILSELATLAVTPRSSELYLVIHPPREVYCVRLAAVPSTHDKVYAVQYNRSGLGAGDPVAFARCLPDMTVRVGSARGAGDAGVIRLRGFAPGSNENTGTMYIGETSEIDWSAGQYLTVMDAFEIWPRHIYLDDSGVIYIDRGYVDDLTGEWVNGTYTNQHLYPAPVPILGPDRVIWQDGVVSSTNRVVVRFDASSSYVPWGSATLSYAWTAEGAAQAIGMNTATPTIYYDAAGVYRVDCRVTATYAGGTASTVTHRYVYIYDDDNPPVTAFVLRECSGERSRGGWSFSIVMHSDADTSLISNRARVIVCTRDRFGDTELNMSPIYSDHAGRVGGEILVSGWIAGETITVHYDTGDVEFDCYTAQHFLDQMQAFPCGLRHTSGTPDDWYQIQNLTVGKALWHWARWRTTLMRLCDCYFPGDTRLAAQISAGVGPLWQQLRDMAESTILATPLFDHLGRMFIDVPPSLTLLEQRSSIPTMTDLTDDWADTVDIERSITTPVSMLDISGVAYDGTNGTPIFSLARGHIFNRYGSVERRERLLMFPTQEQNNTWCGMIMGYLVREYPDIGFRLYPLYRFLDIAPAMRVTCSLGAEDNPRGIEWDDKTLNIRSVGFDFNAQEMMLLMDLGCEEETAGVTGMTGDAPPEPPPPGQLPPPPPPPGPPGEEEPYLEQPNTVFVRTPWAIYGTYNFQDTDPEWEDLGLPSSAGGIFRINIDQENLCLYALCQSGLYRYNFSVSTPAWVRILDFTDMPNNLPEIVRSAVCFVTDRTFAVLSDGTVVLTGFSRCTECSEYDPNLWRGCWPAFITVTYDGSIGLMEYGGECCPYHSDTYHWRFHPVLEGNCYYAMAVDENDNVLIPANCFKGLVDGYQHFCVAPYGASTYSLIAVHRPNDDEYLTFKDSAFLSGDTVISVYHGVNEDYRRVYRVSLLGDSWVDITPSGFNFASESGLDRDLTGGPIVMSDQDRVYASWGGTFTTLLLRTELESPPYRFYHCSCYKDNPTMMFLACDRNPTSSTNAILYTEDAFATVQDKTGTGIPGGLRDVREIRACWTWQREE